MYKDLGDGHLISDKIENNEVFPVGGTFLGGRNKIYMIADFEPFEELFNSIAKNAKNYMADQGFKKWFEQYKKSDLDYSLFCHMLAFNNVMKKNYPDIVDVRKHNGFYDAETPKKLSEAIEAKACACTEFSVLAQGYFQSQNIPTRYVGGEVVSKGNFDKFEAHSFIALLAGDKKYIYDPVNTITLANGSVLPRVAEVVGSKEIFYMETKNIFYEKERVDYSGGEKAAFLKDLPTKKSVIPMKKISTIKGDGRG